MLKPNDGINLVGMVKIQLHNENGDLIHEHIDKNLVVTVGKAYLAAWLAASSQSGEFMSYIGLGTGTTTPVVGNTDLQTPLPTRVQGTLTSAANVWQNVAIFGPGVDTDSAITEAGLFSVSSSGTMFSRIVFAPVNKSSGASLTVTWTVSFN